MAQNVSRVNSILLRLIFLICLVQNAAAVAVSVDCVKEPTNVRSFFKMMLYEGTCKSMCFASDDMSIGVDNFFVANSSNEFDEVIADDQRTRIDIVESPQDLVSKEDNVKSAIEEPPIATFDEWTREKLKKENEKKAMKLNAIGLAEPQMNSASSDVDVGNTVEQTYLPATPQIVLPHHAVLRNYASKECGAKVLFSNDEAENRNGVLNEKEADDYMRNPCERAAHKWLIIELCETILPTALEIANFELFSSGPKDIRIFGSERYPANDWILLGTFLAENSRELQHFPIDVRSYVKFARLELLNQYGKEHYCTLSLVRVIGTSMVDEYEAEAEAASGTRNTPFVVANNDNHSLKAEQVTAVNGSAQSLTENSTEKEHQSATINQSTVNVNLAEHNSEKIVASNQDDSLINVMNVVNSISLDNIKNAFQSTFLRKWDSDRNIIKPMKRSPFEICGKCYDNSTSWSQFCHIFAFNINKSFSVISKKQIVEQKEISNNQTNSNRQVQQTINETNLMRNRKQKPTAAQLLFINFIISSRYCDKESKGDESVAVTQEQAQNVSHQVPEDSEADKGMETKQSSPPNVQENSVPVTTIPKSNGVNYMPPGGALSAKESIFLKLNKRLTALELNVSLSNEYLSELSRRYVVHATENLKNAERLIKAAEEAAINAVKPIIARLEKRVESLTSDVKMLTKIVRSWPLRYENQQSIVNKRGVVITRVSNYDESSLVHPQFLASYAQIWTTGQLFCFALLVNIFSTLTIFAIFCIFTRFHAFNVFTVKTISDAANRPNQKNISDGVSTLASKPVDRVLQTETKLQDSALSVDTLNKNGLTQENSQIDELSANFLIAEVI